MERKKKIKIIYNDINVDNQVTPFVYFVDSYEIRDGFIEFEYKQHFYRLNTANVAKIVEERSDIDDGDSMED